MFRSARRQKKSATSPAAPVGTQPVGPPPYLPPPPAPAYPPPPMPSPFRRDLHSSAEISTLPMPYDIDADHESVIVHLALSFPLDQFGTAMHTSLTELAAEASRRGCSRVYGVQHQLAVTGNWVLVTMLGTGARPVADLDQPTA